MTEPLEIERRFLIHMPDLRSLADKSSHIYTIEQTYLVCNSGTTERIRMRAEGICIQYFHTEKKPVSDETAMEWEEEISRQTYEELMGRQDTLRHPIRKTRYCLPWKTHLLEIDVYLFWQQVAIMEAELQKEGETVEIPPEIKAIREITKDGQFKNVALALHIPAEDKLLLSV